MVTPVGNVVIDTVFDDRPDHVGLIVGVLDLIGDPEDLTELVDDLEITEDRETVIVRPEPLLTGLPELLADTELVFDLLDDLVAVPEPVLLLLTDELRVIVEDAVEVLEGRPLFVARVPEGAPVIVGDLVRVLGELFDT